MPALHRCVIVALSLLVDADAATLLSTVTENKASRATSITLASSKASHMLVADSRLVQYQPCQCVAHNSSWHAPARVAPKCVFIDLGAGDGDNLKTFLAGGYGSMSSCPGGDWEAYLVEANPLFEPALAHLETEYQGKVHSLSSRAAYSCEANTSFYLDVQNRASNYGSSSMSKMPPDVKRSGLKKKVVPTVNFMRLLYEHTLASDYVIVKMDIGGSEWDVVPCLSRSMDAKLIDRLFLNQRSETWQLGHTTMAEMDKAKTALKSIGIDMPSNPALVPR